MRQNRIRLTRIRSNQVTPPAHFHRLERPYFPLLLSFKTGKRVPSFIFAVCTVLSGILFLTTVAQRAEAQGVFGRISGAVTDSQGALIPDVNIVITNEQTRLERTLKTDAHGFYVASELPAGIYTVSATAESFKALKKTGNVLSAGAYLSADLRLEVGASTEFMEVTASAETVNTISGEIARTVDAQQVKNLALNQRNYVQLISLIPGAALTNFDQQTLTTGMSTTSSSVNGRRADGNNFTVDGGFNLDAGANTSQLNNVGIDFIQEVSIKTSNFSAEYGRNAGASVNVVTRSGGEAFHGGAFEYLRNNIFDAINPINKVNVAPGTSAKSLQSILRFNDFGWDVGGPIVHKKLFFFVGEEWKRIRQLATAQRLTLPTTAEMGGNFSDLLPTTKLKAPANAPAGCTIVANVMSPQCITPDGAAIASVFSKMAGVASGFTNTVQAGNALFQPSNPQNWREDIIRLDYQLSNSHSIYGRYLHDDLKLLDAFGTFAPGNSLPTTPTNRVRPGYSYQVADVWIINSHLINESKLNASWSKQRIPPAGNNWQRETYGFQFTPPLGFGGTYPNGIPHVTFTGVAAPTQFTGPYFSLLAPTTDISPSDNLTWTAGSHTLKFGVMYARNRKDQNSRPNSYNGLISFQTNPNSTGAPFADALLGNFQSFTQQSADPVGHFRYNDAEAYVNDNWKVTRSFSLELGLRYQYIGPTYTQGNNLSNFDPSRYNPATAPTLSGGTFNIPGGPNLDQGYVIDGLVRAGNGVPSDQLIRVPNATSAFIQAVPAGGPRGLYSGKNLFAPRFGFAWSPFSDNNTSIRGGFGVFYDKPEGNILFGQAGVVPFLQSATFNNGNLSNISGGAGATPTIFSMSAVDPNFKNASAMQYSLSLQQSLPLGVLLELAYVGNQGRHEVRQPNINVPSFPVVNAKPALQTNQERPYIGYADITQYRSDSNSNYNGLQVFATKRRGNLLTTVSYTWSRALGDSDTLGANAEPDCPFRCQLPSGQVIDWKQYYYGRMSFDRQHIFVATYNYALPFFKTQSGVAGVLLGGWELGGITRAQTGQPLTVTASQPVGSLPFTRRVDIASGVPLYSGFTCPALTKCWFNPAYATDPATNKLIAINRPGDAPAGGIIGPGYYNWDFSVRKRFDLPRENMNLIFQTDFFNAFNHANWGNPGVTANNSALGTINTANPARQIQFGLKLAF